VREREREKREKRDKRETREKRERERERERARPCRKERRENFSTSIPRKIQLHTHTLLIKKDDRRSSGGTRSDKTDESSHRNVRAAAASTGVRLRGVRAETSAWGNGSANRAFEFRLSVSAV